MGEVLAWVGFVVGLSVCLAALALLLDAAYHWFADGRWR